MRSWTVWLLTTLAVASPAFAQEAEGEGHTNTPTQPMIDPLDAEARALFEAGQIAFDNARFEVALRYFQQAYDASGRPRLRYNVALTLDRLRRDDEAIAEYEAVLASDPDPELSEIVTGRLRALRAIVQREEIAAAAPTIPETPGPVDDGGGDVASEWWFWTLLAVVVLGGVGAGIGVWWATEQVEAPLGGTDGRVVMTLELP